MVNRVFLIAIFLLSFLNAQNILQGLKIEDSLLKIDFKKDIEKKDLRAFIIPTKKVTKYVFDFKNCKLKRGVKSLKNLKGDIKSVRVAQYKSDIVRVVIDSKKPYTLKYNQKENSTFNISLPSSVKLESKKVKTSDIKSLFKKDISLKEQNYKNNKTVKENSAKTKNRFKSANLKKSYVVVIDPGHGGKKPGTKHAGIMEKDVVLQISKRVYKYLKQKGIKVYMTRYRDKHISLKGRMRLANKLNADLFVSIHANSVPSKARAKVAKGIETYFLQTTRNARAKRVAAIENREILEGKDTATKNVLLNAVFTGPKIVLSNKLAIDVQKGMLSNLRANFKGVKDNGVRGAPFYVLVGAQMPAILIEVGYLSHKQERARLLNPIYQDLLAKGISEGIINYLKNRERELE
jgi:N-acetylmuramoyl-L-alanine amidase